MIRMTLALLMCIGLTMVMFGRDVDIPEGSDDPDMDLADAATDPGTLTPSNRLALDDVDGAVQRALAATAMPAPAPETAVTPVDEGVQTASLTQLEPVDRDLHYVTGNRVNIRSGPSTANPVVDQVVGDQRVEVLEETPDGWMRIRVVDTGVRAYIFGRFLAPLDG